jgi:decaprenylphospho-beta-D-ribofuranose 2-oxidase
VGIETGTQAGGAAGMKAGGGTGREAGGGKGARDAGVERLKHVPTDGERLLCGWGRTAPTRAWVLRPRAPEEVLEALASGPAARGGAIARGAGRSYGDAAQNGGGAVIDATALCGRLELDAERGLLHTGAGRRFSEILLFLAARGYTLPVVPGTRRLTVGGAIAADVHGKNHLRDGSFARHVESFTLCAPAGGLRTVSARQGAEEGRAGEGRDGDGGEGDEEERDLFDATLGGMGLTGVIVDAALRVAPLRSVHAVADIDRFDRLEQAVAALAGTPRHRYSIAWVDLFSPGAAFGRSVLTRSDEGPPAPPAGAPFRERPLVTVPRGLPGGLLRPAAVRAFNEVHWRTAPRRARGRTLSMSAQLFPLDALGAWSRLYGLAGMLQYQFVVPRGEEETLLRVVHRLRERRAPMYLAVLKRFGPGGRASAGGRAPEKSGPLSFPIEGLTFAIDMPAGAEEVYGALDEADETVAGAGGRVYLAKDSRMSAETAAAMYPGLERFAEVRGRVDPDGVLRSDLGRRLGLCG